MMLQIKTDTDGRVVVVNYTDTPIEGFTQISSIPKPEEREGKYPVMYFRNGKIEYDYLDIPEMPEEETAPDTPVIPYGERVDSLIRERYSLSEELAILRQKDEKPEEYEAYYNYAEECKAKAREETI